MSSLSSLDGSSKILTCSNSLCVSNKVEDDDYLTCMKCKRRVHYHCTKLPAYQIHIINTKRNHNYYCQNCVNVPQELLDRVSLRERLTPLPTPIKEVTEQLRREVKACEALIKNHQNVEEELKEVIKQQSLNIKDLKKKSQSTSAINSLDFIDEALTKKVDSMKECLLSAIKNEHRSLSTTYADIIKANNCSSIQEKSKQVNNMNEIVNAIKISQKEEKSEELNKKRRSGNVIIHGLPEETPIIDDKKWASNFIKDLHIKVTIRHVTRIGQVVNGKSRKSRPIKIVLKNKEEKKRLLSRLHIIKDMYKYDGISVTEDLTPNERKQVLELSKEAAERNNSVMRLIWRVKGCSETGFFLKNTDNTHQIVSKSDS